VIVFLIGLVFTYFTTGELSIMPGSETEDSSSDSATEYVSPIISSVSGDWYDLYFTSPSYPDRPENRPAEVPIIEGLVSAINSAKETLDIAIYELNLPEIGEAVLAAQRRGVMVRLVTDSDEIDHLEVLIDLNKNGIPMVGDQREAIMHNKFVVVDKQAVWTGSWNFTPNGTYRNNNNAIYIKSPELAELYHQEFEELYNGEFGPRSPSNPTKQVLLNDTMIEVCFAPEDNCGNRLIALVNQAQSSIHVMAFSFTHDGIGEAIVARGNAGVEVRAVFERRSSDTEHSELGRLQKAGFDVVTDGNPYTYHHKVIVVDGQTVALGSFNFSENADSSNDENILIIDNPKIATEYIKEFERNYQRATE
jgi:phosphatidylserine/phosphatidylglycerophosphate/cardiolipin synthase-like enzyme